MLKRASKLLFLLPILLSFFVVSALEFNGTVYDVNSTVLNATNVSVMIKDQSFADLGTNSTLTNSTGWFNMTLPTNTSYMFQLTIVYTNSTTNHVQYVSQSLPLLPYSEFSQIINTNFYLKEAGTINITAINSSSVPIPNNQFGYQIKDKRLGYPVTGSNVGQYSSVAYVPKDRNYSIMIYPSDGSPQHFVPVSFDWSNFSSSSSYSIDSLSSFNATTMTLAKQFNTTESMARITGYVSMAGVEGWEELTIVPYLLEPGPMISSDHGILPFNASGWSGSTDEYTLTSGFYNITLPYSTTETVQYILYAAAVNDTRYGGYRNLTVTGDTQINFTLYNLLGENSTIVMRTSSGGTRDVNTTKQRFNLLNSTSDIISNMNAHIEAIVDYSNYNATEFTYMVDISGSAGNFSIPLINSTGFKEINIYSMDYSPETVSTRTSAQIQSDNNFTMNLFNVSTGDIEGEVLAGNIDIAMYKSNSTCDVPSPPSGCLVTSSSTMNNFRPISAVMGGGSLSLRIGIGDVEVHYVDVDLLASGPPAAEFDNDEDGSVSGSAFSKALRFGSNGPRIYDYVLISIPYVETAGSGLDDSSDVNVSIPVFYGDSWSTPIWNVSENGTSGSMLAGNYSHYSEHSTEWEILMGNSTCVSTLTSFNITYPCFINTSSNRIWIRLPHFSGTSPSVTGSAVAASATTTTPGGGGGTSGGTTGSSTSTVKVWSSISPDYPAQWAINRTGMSLTNINISVKERTMTVRLSAENMSSKPATVSAPVGEVYQYLNMTLQNMDEDNLKSVKMNFRVEKAWMEANSINKEAIVLSRYTNTWNNLPTSVVSEDSDYVYFTANSPGFSIFAVTVDTGTLGEETTTTVVATTMPTGGNVVEPTSTIPLSGNLGIGLVVGLGILAVVAIFLYKKMGHKKKISKAAKRHAAK